MKRKCLVQTLLLLSFGLSCSAQFSDDIQNYEKNCLGEGAWHCLSGECISIQQKCDGNHDCSDGSDENYCGHTIDLDLCEQSRLFICLDKKNCISRDRICNNNTDCEDGSDEADCTDLLETPKNTSCKGFQCKDGGKCISSAWICDSIDDCVDKSDEDLRLCKQTKRTHIYSSSWDCPVHKHRCLDKSYCLPPEYMCNDMPDCRDGTDEGEFCANWTTMCNNVTCGPEIKCKPDRTGPSCPCDTQTYTIYDSKSDACEDVDECIRLRPECSHSCVNHIGHFKCNCDEGFTSDAFGYLCYASDPEPILFYSTLNEIRYIKMRSLENKTLATGLKQAHGVTSDGQFVYWVETGDGHQSIVRAQLDNVNSTKQVLVALGLEDPGDIAIDWMGGHLYFTDAERGMIAVCNLNGSMCTQLKTKVKHPKFITLDVKNGKMYWADMHVTPVIMEAGMDGSFPRVLVEDLREFATGLCIDSPNDRLYYVDQTIKVVKIDVREVYTFVREQFLRPYAIAVFENDIYWTDWTTNVVMRHQKIGLNRGALFNSQAPIYDLHIYHPLLLNKTKTPCSNSSCSHLCLLSSNTTYSCACPETMTLVDNTTCKVIENHNPEFLIVSSGGIVVRIPYQLLGNAENDTRHFDGMRVQAMAYDSFRDNLYMFNGQTKMIENLSMKNFVTGPKSILVSSGLEDVVDLGYDYVSDMLYIMDAGRGWIEALSLKNDRRALVYRFRPQETPLSLALMPEYGRMLVAVMENDEEGEVHVDGIGLDGEGRQHLIMNNLVGEFSLEKSPHVTVRYSHFSNSIFISDESAGTIDMMHPEGTGREIFRRLSTTVTGLAVANHIVFWTDQKTNKLYWGDIQESRKIRRFEFSVFPNTQHLHIVATVRPLSQRNPLLRHPCHQNPNPCSDICVQTSHPKPDHVTNVTMGYKCLCPPGLVMMDHHCKSAAQCKPGERYCHKSNTCFNEKGLCDGKKDCEFGEDEEDCNVTPGRCTSNEKLCYGSCISRNEFCVVPTTKGPFLSCTSTQFRCNNSTICIERTQLCDDVDDCPDGSDESECGTRSCISTEFMCADGSCIIKPWQCDGDEDCRDGSDEADCVESHECNAGYFTCKSGGCVDLTKRCDLQDDCDDSSDEINCDTVDYDTEEEVKCGNDEFACELNKTICLPSYARCNHHVECPGATDEVDCDRRELFSFTCHKETYRMPIIKVCDGVNDCGDWSDETQAACKKVQRKFVFSKTGACKHGFLCDSGECLEWRNVCNHQNNCFDHSDEGPICEKACEKNLCSQECHPTPKGPACACIKGFELSSDNRTCVDVDECTKDVCAHKCTNTKGSYICSCYESYALRSDRESCKSTTGSMSLLYTNGGSVRSIASDKHAMRFNDTSVGNFTSIDLDVRRNYLYLSSAKKTKIIMVNDTEHKIEVTNIGVPSKLAVDWITGNVYFADVSPQNSCFRVCNVARKKCAKLQKIQPGAKVTALALDPLSLVLFYCISFNSESVLWKSTLYGGKVSDINNVNNCSGIVVDSYGKFVYVSENEPARILKMDYSGSSISYISIGGPTPSVLQTVGIYEEHLYILTVRSHKQLHRCLLYAAKTCEPYAHLSQNATNFVVNHVNVQRNDIDSSCDRIKCDNVCVYADTGPVCVCDYGTLSKDGTCPQIDSEELALFNGWTASELGQAHQVSFTLVSIVLVLFILYLIVFLYYHFVYKPKRDRINAVTVRFQNIEGTSVVTPEIDMLTSESTPHEYVNPLQFARNLWQKSITRRSHPVGTAGLHIEVPFQEDLSDTESDQDGRDTKRIIRRETYA